MERPAPDRPDADAHPRGGGQPVPEAASACRFTDAGNESYRCTLRPGLKFADGEPLTAKDVKFSIDRVRAIKDENGPSSLLSTLDNVEVKGADTVVFHLKTPDATFPFKLSTPAAGIVSEKNYDAKKLREGFSVDGSGPYTMKAEVKGNGWSAPSSPRTRTTRATSSCRTTRWNCAPSPIPRP